MEVLIERFQGNSENLMIRSQENMKVFGFSINISESYDVRGFMDEVKHLIEIDKYKNVKRKN